MTEELNSFHITQIILVIFAAIFWLQIYIRGFGCCHVWTYMDPAFLQRLS